MPLEGLLVEGDLQSDISQLPRRDDVRGIIVDPWHEKGLVVFLVEHQSHSYRDFRWGFPGGGIKERKETLSQAAKREVGREEIISPYSAQGAWIYDLMGEDPLYSSPLFATFRNSQPIAKQSHYFGFITDSSQGLMVNPAETKMRRGAFYPPQEARSMLPYQEQRVALDVVLPKLYALTARSRH